MTDPGAAHSHRLGAKMPHINKQQSYFSACCLQSGGLDKAEEYTPVAATELGTAAAWAHRYPHIKKQGAQAAT